MTKLANFHREKIRDLILAHRFDGDRDRLKKEATALGIKVYERAFPRKQRDLMETLPKGWLHEEDHASVKAGSCFTRLPFGKAMRMPMTKAHGCILSLEATDTLAQQISAHESAEKGLRDTRSAAARQIAATLGSFSTVKALREGWPEIAAFIDVATHSVPVPNLPAPIIRDLNVAMKLPPTATKKAA